MKYQVGGSLGGDDPSYVVRQADAQIYDGLKAGDFCYVLNCRQIGKTSLLQRTKYRLEIEDYTCVYLDVTRLGSEETTPMQWYKGVIVSLFYGLNLTEWVDFKKWWEEQAELSPVQRLHQFVEQVLLPVIESERIFIFIDEIDSLQSLGFPVSDFFAWIRHCYNMRADKPDFNRLVFALFGVVSPSNLIIDKRRTPFNIGTAIEIKGFQLHEATPLLEGLEVTLKQPAVVLREIIRWTGGQPFLTQKLCQLVQLVSLEWSTATITIPNGAEAFWVEQLVLKRIIQHWQSQDEPEHFRTIQNRLLFNEQRAGQLLAIYQKVLQAELATSGECPEDFAPIAHNREQETEINKQQLQNLVMVDNSSEQTELLLSGLVEKRNGYLRVKNLIYVHIFNAQWVASQLDNLRPYSQTFNAWIASDNKDKSRLLRGQALKDTQAWAQGKSLSNLDYQFLATSQDYEQQEVQTALETARVKEIEARLAQEKKTAKEVEARLAQEKKTAFLQKYLLITVGIGLVISSSLGIGTFNLYHQALKSEAQARISEIRALVSSSEGLYVSNRRLDALIEAIKAKHRLQKLTTNTNIKPQVDNVLRQAVYGADEYNRFSGHAAAVLAVDISPDSSLIASASTDKTIKLWQRDGTEIATLKGHQGAVRAVAFSPDGHILASASEDGTIKLWQRDGANATWHLSTTFKGHTASIWGIAFSRDGQFLASASWDKTVRIWRQNDANQAWHLSTTFKGYRRGFWGIAFSPQGNIVAAANLDGTVKLWKRDGSSWHSAKPLEPLKGHTAWVVGVAFSPDGETIASASEDKTVKLWQRDSTDGSYRQYKTLQGHTAGVWGVAFSPDGETITSASLDKTIKLWNIDGTELKTLRGHSASVWGVNFSPDGSFIASAGAENQVRLWQSQNPFQKSIIAHSAGIWSIAIAPDSSTIATASHENTARFWSRGGKLLKTLTEENVVFQVSFSDDGKLIALAGYDDTVKLKTRDGISITTYKDAYSEIIGAVLSPNGEVIAIANVDKIAQIWQRHRPTLQVLKGHLAEVWQVAFSPDGRLVASASGDGTAKLWKLDGKLVTTLVGHSAAVWRVAFSPDSQMVATGSGDNTVKLWSLDGKLLKTFKGHTSAIWGVAFSPDGKIIASGSVDATVKLWKLDGKELITLRGHTAAIRGIAISPDGTLLVSGGDDNTLILWNLPRILNLDVSNYACTLVKDYLKTNAALEADDRSLCNHFQNY